MLFFFSSRRRHTRFDCDWSSDVCSSDLWKDGIFTRAVLYDIPQLKGVDWIEPGVPITRADLEAWEKKSGVKAGQGDVVLLRSEERRVGKEGRSRWSPYH